MAKDTFFGRKACLEVLEKRIKGLKDGYRQNLAIVGEELVGKTTLIFNFLDKFCDNHIVILYLEIRPEPLASFAKRFIGILLYNFLVNSGLPLKEDIDFLVNKSEQFIPQTAKEIKAILSALDKRKKNNIFTDLLSLCESLHQETGKSCVVIFDEFHNLENVGINNLYREWSKLLILQKNTMYIIISSMKFKTKAILSKNLSLLFGNFHTLAIEPFNIKTSERYLEYRLEGLNLNKGLKNFIVNFTGGYPFYLKVMAEELLKLKAGEINLVDVLEHLLFEPSGILNQRFSNYLKRFLDLEHNQDYISILYFISSGHNKLKDLAHIMHKSAKELGPRINYLLELDTLNRSVDFLNISDRVFNFWLRFVYKNKLQSMTFDAKNQKMLFRQNIKSMIEEFLLDAQKPITERMIELLHLFHDETVQIERKRLRLARFREIKPLEFNNKSIREGLIGRSSDTLWIMAFKHDLLTEEDIAEFVKECKKYHHKLQKKIIIAFQDIDTNARLRALEEKILTWDVNNLNQVLDLFSKPRVIV